MRIFLIPSIGSSILISTQVNGSISLFSSLTFLPTMTTYVIAYIQFKCGWNNLAFSWEWDWVLSVYDYLGSNGRGIRFFCYHGLIGDRTRLL